MSEAAEIATKRYRANIRRALQVGLGSSSTIRKLADAIDRGRLDQEASKVLSKIINSAAIPRGLSTEERDKVAAEELEAMVPKYIEKAIRLAFEKIFP